VQEIRIRGPKMTGRSPTIAFESPKICFALAIRS
jgi:hypothetical protein